MLFDTIFGKKKEADDVFTEKRYTDDEGKWAYSFLKRQFN
jgi:hypothetical protein